MIVTTGVSGVLLLVAIIVALQAWFQYEEQAEAQSKAESSPNVWLDNIRHEQQARLSSYRWVDRDKQTVAIPIADAMRIMVENGGKAPTTRP